MNLALVNTFLMPLVTGPLNFLLWVVVIVVVVALVLWLLNRSRRP